MHATTNDDPPAAAEERDDDANHHAAKLDRARSDAIQILHQVMLQAADSLNGYQEDTHFTTSTTQRMRIAMRSAMYLIDLTAATPTPNRARKEADRDSHQHSTLQPTTPTPNRDSQGADRRPHQHRDVQPIRRAPDAPDAKPILAAAGAGARRFGERLDSPSTPDTAQTPSNTPRIENTNTAPTNDASPINEPARAPESPATKSSADPSPTPSTHSTPSPTHDSPPLPSSAPSVSSVVNPLPTRPPDLTFEELALLSVRQRGFDIELPFELAGRLRAWHLYSEATGISPPFYVTPESLLPPRRTRKHNTTTAPPIAPLQAALDL